MAASRETPAHARDHTSAAYADFEINMYGQFHEEADDILDAFSLTKKLIKNNR